jgi:PEGA domain
LSFRAMRARMGSSSVSRMQGFRRAHFVCSLGEAGLRGAVLENVGVMRLLLRRALVTPLCIFATASRDTASGYYDSVMFRACRNSRIIDVLIASMMLALPALAKDTPLAVIDWPDSGTPQVRFTFGKFKALPGMGNLHGYVMDTTAENLSPRRIPNARFKVYLFDKNKVRIGEDTIALSNVGPGETVKFETTVTTSGNPASVSIEAISEAARTVSMTVNSTPEGAVLKVDGVEAGTTPRMITVGTGKHILTFSKEGFTTGNFPLEISREDVSGGTVSYELGASAMDSIELRDGSVLNGDLVSISGMDVEVRVGGSIQHIGRNKINRLILVERQAPAPDIPPAAAPAPNQ